MDKALQRSDWKGFEAAPKRIRGSAASCAAAASPPTSRRPRPAGSRPTTRRTSPGSSDGTRHAAHRLAQPRPGPRDHVRADRVARCSASRSRAIAPAHLGAGVRPRRQPDRRLAHAARPGQRDALGLAGDREERHRPRRRAPRERGRGHRVRRRAATASRAPTARCASTRWRRSIPASSTSTSRTGRRCRATFPNGCHIAEVEIDPETGEMRDRVLRRLRRRRQHHQPPDRRRPDAGRRHPGRGHIFSEQAVYDAIPASCSPAASWTTPCRAPGWSAA